MGKQYECQLKRKPKPMSPEKYDAYLEKQRLSYANNPERAKHKREIMRRWRAKNTEKVRAYYEKQRLWKAKNPEKAREKMRAYYEKRCEKQRLWKANNPEKANAGGKQRDCGWQRIESI